MAGLFVSTFACAESAVELTRSLGADSSLPDVVQSDSSPVQWTLNWQSPPQSADPATTEKSSNKPDESLEGWSLFVEPIGTNSAAKATSPKTIAIQSSAGGWSAKLTDPLPNGVYEIQLRRPATSRKWTDVLPWDKQPDTDTPLEAASWALVVLPPAGETNEAAKAVPDPSLSRGPSLRRWIANWDTQRELDSQPLQADAETSSSRLSSILPSSTSATKMLNRLPIGWGRDETTTDESQARVWAKRAAVVRSRLQRIASLNATGIALPASNPEDGTEANLIHRLVEAEANVIGLEVWIWDDSENSDLATTEESPAANEPVEPHREPVLALRSNDQTQTVVDLRRAAKTSLKARFAPRMTTESDSDLVWLGTNSTAMQTSPSGSDVDLPAPLAESINVFPVKAWLEDWTYWVAHRMGTHSTESVGMVIDESLLNQGSVPGVAQIEEAIAIWQIAWGEGTRWLTASKSAANDLGSTTASGQRGRTNTSDSSKSNLLSSNELVHLRQVHHNGSTMLVFLNEAPWAVRVTLPLANLVNWNAALGDEFTRDDGSTTNAKTSGINWSSLSMNRPSVSMLGSTVIVPADGVVVCQTEQELSRSLTYGYRIEGGSVAVEQLTQDVTKIVEHLGLLGELASMSASNANGFARNDARESNRTIARTWIRSVTDRQSTELAAKASESDADTDSGSWGASIWSSERWGFSRAVSNKSAGFNSSETTKQPISFASTPIARTSATQSRTNQSSTNRPSENSTSPTVVLRHEMATDQLAPAGSRSVTHVAPATGQATSRFETYRNLILNGGFESPHEIGIAGWMHSQHPVNAVEVDSRTYFSGTHCVRLLGKDERGTTAWLISREIPTPASGRIGVSMALRGERPVTSIPNSVDPAAASLTAPSSDANSMDPQTEDLVVRIAIEGERDGHPIRHTTQLTIPTDGQWQSGRIDLQCLDLDPLRDTNLRLTIDNLSTSAVWIDDIVVTDYFASQAERSELQSLAYLAVNGLQSADLAPTARLLRNYWAQELLRVAQQSPVSLLPSNGALSDNARSTPGPSAGSGTLNGAMRSIGLPAPAWEVATQGVSSASPEKTQSVAPSTRASDSAATSPAMPNSSASEPNASQVNAAQVNAAQSNTTESARDAPKEDRPVSLSRRIRSWIPAPLRF